MSAHTNSPDHTPIQPLHNPSLAAQVIVSQALVDNGGIAPLAKKGNPKLFVSPTDNLLTPCTQKLNATKKKHFNKKLLNKTQLFLQAENIEPNKEEQVSEQMAVPTEKTMEDDDENPF